MLVATLLTPLFAAVAAALLARWPAVRDAVAVLAGATLSVLTISLAVRVGAGELPVLRLVETMPGLAISFAVEPLGAGFAALAACLWTVTSIYASGYIRARPENNQTRFQIFFALAIGVTIAAAYADNLFALYVFYEALTFATVPLVAHIGGTKVIQPVRLYLGYLVGTSTTMLLLAVVWLYTTHGTLAFAPGGIVQAPPGTVWVMLLLFVVGTSKAALMPFHGWLPAAMVAPIPVSALLHAVAVVKLGVFVILKVTVYIFGFELLRESGAAAALLPIAVVTLLLGAIFALREDDLKRRLAYSTVSQLAYIVVGALLASSLGLLAAGMQVLAHALAKITLFFCVGTALLSTGRTKVSELGGVGRAMPLTMAAWLVASFSIVGIPLTGGFWAKWTLGLAAIEEGQLVLVGIVLAGSLLSLAYLVVPGLRAFFGAPTGIAPLPRAEAPVACIAALWITASLSVGLFFLSDRVFEYLSLVSLP